VSDAKDRRGKKIVGKEEGRRGSPIPCQPQRGKLPGGAFEENGDGTEWGLAGCLSNLGEGRVGG